MSARDVKIIAIVALMCASAPAWSDLPDTIISHDNFNISITHHSSASIKDQTYHADLNGVRYLVVRFTGGRSLQVLLRNASANQCPQAFVLGRATSENRILGSGCLVTADKTVRLRLDYSVNAPGAEAEQLLRHVDPVVWLSGYDKTGAFQGSVTPLLPLYNLHVRYPLAPNAP